MMLVLAREPAPPLDVAARTISIVKHGATARVGIELSIVSDRDAPETVVLGTATAPRRQLALLAGKAGVVRYDLELQAGREHHLVFTVQDRERKTIGYLRVNLDPALEPQDLGTVLQYRAVR
ncbi:MAG TPA: hypothetical protein VJS92_03660 [Candidatus Polarisedimenticolaceae bacterium]|nr:hypothetical protein [Candidatus Polarisedimenticolaceae bacterium]